LQWCCARLVWRESAGKMTAREFGRRRNQRAKKSSEKAPMVRQRVVRCDGDDLRAALVRTLKQIDGRADSHGVVLIVLPLDKPSSHARRRAESAARAGPAPGDRFESFLAVRCELGGSYVERASNLLLAYRAWAAALDLPQPSSRALASGLKARGFRRRKSSTVWWTGVRVRAHAPT
jgi:hypothetical protein